MNFNPKQVQERIEQIHARLKELTDQYNGKEHAELQVLGLAAELNSVLSERAEMASQRLEGLTDRLVGLTKWLIGLTAALVFFTLALLFFTYYLYRDTNECPHREQGAADHGNSNP
jgi:predicted PurR-regulated permease PerM